MNFLTAREKRLIAFVVGAALVGVAVKTWRDGRAMEPAMAALQAEGR